MSAHHYVAATEFARLQGPASVPMATRILTVPRRYASAVVASMANVISKNGNVAAILALRVKNATKKHAQTSAVATANATKQVEAVNATRTGKEWIVRYRIVLRIAAITVRVPIPQRDLYVPVIQNGVAITVILRRAQLARRRLISNALGTVSARVESASAVLDIRE